MKLNKLRKRINNRFKNNHYSCMIGYNSALSSIYRRELAQNATEEELIVREWLKENKIPHRFQKTYLAPFHRIVDFYIPGKKIIIEIDGGYHLNTKKHDARKDEIWLRERKTKTIRITNDCVRSGEFKKIILDNLYGL